MRLIPAFLVIVLAVLSTQAPAQTTPLSSAPGAGDMPADNADRLCAGRIELCNKRYRHLISHPAHALSWSSYGTFALHERGVDWTGQQGLVSFTIHRPQNYVSKQPVRLRLVYDIPGDADGNIGFSITPTSFNHGSGFETYGGESTGLITAAAGNIHEQSVTFTFPNAYSLGGNWWYFEFRRTGDFAGKLRLMSVSLEY